MSISLPILVVILLVLLLLLERERRRRSELRRRIAGLEEDLEALSSERKEADSLKSDILARIGASLRKPLESVRRTAMELTRPFDRSPEARVQLDRLVRGIEEIEDFLEVIRQIAFLGRMDLSGGSPFLTGEESSEIVLDDLLLEILDDWEDRLAERGVSLAVSLAEDVTVRGSLKYLRQAVGNVLSEVASVAPEGGMVSVLLGTGDGRARMVMECRGSSGEGREGSALGVELARQIVSAHQGWLTGDPVKGRYVMELGLAGDDGNGYGGGETATR